MTTRTNFFTPPKFLTHLNGHPGVSSDSAFEFDESDLWNNNGNFDQSSSSKHKKSKHLTTNVVKINRIPASSARSLPVNVPDWSNINYKNENGEDSFDDDDDDDEYCDRKKFVPPHEYLAKTRGASLSVEEGRGRTLKGRDMSRVRNAIWKQCGFED